MSSTAVSRRSLFSRFAGSANRLVCSGKICGIRFMALSQYVNRVIKKKDGVVNNTFVQMMEALGYDIEFTYVKRID